jgi:serine/threonine-protein kinase
MTEPPTQEIIDGRYRLLRMIGRGGMGSVWEGQHIQLGRRVAIKFIEADHAGSAEARARFDNEAKAAAAIQSKYAISIEHHGVTPDGRPFIVMEFLSGEPLDKRLDRMGKLSLAETARILQQVCRGLARAHERGIIHRDLKPENIFLVRDEDEGGEIAKVLDFGIAKIRGDGLGISNSTRTGAILGTPYYMSPEQARGLRDIDPRADIWSLGVIAFRCVTGKLPFDGESVGDLLVKICVAPLPVPSQLAPGLPQTFDGWFARALERDPAARFPTVQDCAQTLSEIAGITVRRSVNSGSLQAVHGGSPSFDPGRPSPAGALPGGTMPSPMPYGPHALSAGGAAPVMAHAHYGTPSPYSGTPLPPGNVTSAGLSTSTTGLQPSRGRGLLIGLAALFVLLGAGAAAFVYVAYLRDPEPVARTTASTAAPTATATASASSSTDPIPSLGLLTQVDPTPSSSAKKGPGTTTGPGVPGVRPTAKPTAAVPTATTRPSATVAPQPTSRPTVAPVHTNPSGF